MLRKFTQQKINNGNSGNAGSRLQRSRLVGVTLHCSPPWKNRPYNAAFCQNSTDV